MPTNRSSFQSDLTHSEYQNAIKQSTKLYHRISQCILQMKDFPMRDDSQWNYLSNLWINPKGVLMFLKIQATNYTNFYNPNKSNSDDGQNGKKPTPTSRSRKTIRGTLNTPEAKIEQKDDDIDSLLEITQNQENDCLGRKTHRNRNKFKKKQQNQKREHFSHHDQSLFSHEPNYEVKIESKQDGQSEGSHSEFEGEDDSPVVQVNKYTRGPYKSYTAEEKLKAVTMLRQNKCSIVEISRALGIPCKNIKRWSQEGCMRKKGGGRKKFSPHTEAIVAETIRSAYSHGCSIKYETVQRIARERSDDPNFKASRGWVTKFVSRKGLKDEYNFY